MYFLRWSFCVLDQLALKVISFLSGWPTVHFAIWVKRKIEIVFALVILRDGSTSELNTGGPSKLMRLSFNSR